VEVPAVSYREISGGGEPESSADIRARVIRARTIQQERFALEDLHTNARMRPGDVQRWCALDRRSQDLLERAIIRLGISARGWNRILKVARTVADLGDSADIAAEHLAEAIRYRSLDRRG
jgi:magnesium chelatase family protein